MGGSRLAEALELIEQNLHDDDRSVADRRIKALLLQTRPAFRRDAIQTFEELARQAPPTAGEKFLLARLYAGGDEWAKAGNILRVLLVAEPRNPDYLTTLAKILLDHKQVDEAASLVERLVEITPRSFPTIELNARHLQEQGKPDQAVAALEAYTQPATVELQPVAAALEQIGQLGPAEALFRQSITRSNRPAAVLNLALFLGRQSRGKEALDLCETVLPTWPPALFSNTCVQI